MKPLEKIKSSLLLQTITKWSVRLGVKILAGRIRFPSVTGAIGRCHRFFYRGKKDIFGPFV